MKKALFLFITVLIMVQPSFVAQSLPAAKLFSASSTALFQKPVLFADLGKSFATPDAMAIDKLGRLYLSVPNFANYSFGAKICRFDENNQPLTWFDSLPLHPVTKRVHPMGMDFGSDGNLYIADAQSSPDGKNISRLLRVVVEDGLPLRAEVLVNGFYAANGVKWFKDRVYVSDSYLYVEGEKNQSGVFSFSLAELNKGSIDLSPGGKDAHLLCRFTSKVFNGKNDQGGVDGIAFDAKGNLYAGNFSDGVISRVEIGADGKLRSQKIIVDSDAFRCCDGMFYDKKSNCIYLANFANNSLQRLNLAKQKLELLWENEDATGEDGLLDQPCEPVIYKGRLIVVNFDSFPVFKNTKADGFHTMSAFQLNK
jgi:DNA-binding beta-propeller fold protein YncE